MSIGDINSQERGTGARYNDGKPPIELYDFGFIAAVVAEDEVDDDNMSMFFTHMADFQVGRDISCLSRAMQSLAWATNMTVAELLREGARVFGYGREKYAAWNWAKGMAWSVPLGCIGRHALAIFDGEMMDQESGFHHAGHVACNICMLFTFTRNYPEGNDLPIRELGTKNEVPITPPYLTSGGIFTCGDQNET